MTESAKMEVLRAIAFGDLGRAREIEESARESKRKYYYDDCGNEYWYDENGKQHYTRVEG